ncbi:MAG TPA: hypothetical protein VGM90_29395 [Kofleriaceae bacterium]|jgi:hypothetical protein
MAIGAEFIAKLLPALDELEARWHSKKLSPDKAIAFCLRCRQRLGTRPEFAALRQRIDVTLDAAMSARDSSPIYIRRATDELERRWARGDNDNYRDDFDDCAALLARTARRSPERTRVLAVIASVLDEAHTAAATSPVIRDYLGEWLDRAAWRRAAAQPLPPARPRASFKKTRAAKLAAATSAKRALATKRTPPREPRAKR